MALRMLLLLAGCARAAPEAPPPRTARAGALVFGVNEAVTIPKKFIVQGTVAFDDEPALLATDAAAARAVGVGVVRGPTQVYPYLDHMSLAATNWDWTRADRWVSAVQAAGLDAVLMVGPWPGNQTAGYTAAYVPSDMEAYVSYVKRVVERYDGDGQDDMPGLLRGIHTWEVDNEPDLHNSRPPRDMKASVPPEKFQTPSEYAQVLKASAAAIREADPAARVLGGGFYAIRTPQGRRYAEQLVAVEGVLAAIDAVSIHCYFDQDTLEPVEETLRVTRALFPGKPIWVTETSVPARGAPPYQTEAWQGKMVAAIYGAFLAGGADRVFWHTLADPPVTPQLRQNLPFATNSLLSVPRPAFGTPSRMETAPEDKPAGAVYRRLAGLLASSDPATWREEAASGGRLLRTDAGWLAFWGTPAVPEGAGEAIDLLTGATLAATGSVTAPAFIRVKP